MAEEGLIIKLFADAKDFNTGVGKAVSDAKSKFKGLGDELAKEFKRVETVGTTAFKGITGAIGGAAIGATAAVASLVKSSNDAFADFQQLEGGVETLFGKSADIVMDYAVKAYKTAGISANQYMETVTSFSASLLQSLGGDTQKAAEYADRAMIDMADNANKMGSSMSSIQTAYQGFAKQNYTMLDNLKLGYGGTKEEMERLIKDAAAMTEVQKELGITVDASSMSFGNIVNAISVVQKSMGITGTTYKEAEETITGSLNMVKASWQDVLVSISGGGKGLKQSVSELVYSIGVYAKNIIPVIQEALFGIGDLIKELLPVILKTIPEFFNTIVPQLLEGISDLGHDISDAIGQIIGGLVPIIAENLPVLIDMGVEIVNSILKGIEENIFVINDAAGTIIDRLLDGIRNIMPRILAIARAIVGTIAEGFIEYKGLIMEMGIQIITTLAQGLADAAPTLGPALVDTIMHLIDVLVENMPAFLESVITIIVNIADSIWQKLPEILGKIGTLVYDLANKLLDNIGKWGPALLKVIASIIAMVLEVILALLISIFQHLGEWWNSKIKPWFDNIGKSIKDWWEGVKSSAKEKLNAIKEVVKGVVDMIKNDVKTKMSQIKTDIGNTVTNIKTAITNKINEIKNGVSEKIRSIVENVITTVQELPGKMLSIGHDVVEGLWNGILGAGEWLKDKVTGFFGGITDWVKGIFDEHSPSKVFEQIGSYLTEGLAIGIEDETDMLKRTAKDQIGQLTGIYDGINLGTPHLALAGDMSALSRMGQSVQTITNDNGNVFNFYQSFNGAGEAAGDEMFRQFQRKVRYAGGVL